MLSTKSITINQPLGINVKSLIPYNVIIFSQKIFDAKLLKQYLQSDLFNIINVYDKVDTILNEFSNFKVKIDIVCVHSDTNKLSIDLIKSLKLISPNLLTIFISQFVTRVLIKEIKNIGVNSLILKPFSKNQIYEKFAEVLGREDLISKKVLVGFNRIEIDLNNLIIPPLPIVLMNVMNFDESKSMNGSADLERIMLPDKGLTIDIIKIANSSFYGRSGSIKTLKDAITLLGIKTIKNLVILQARKRFSSFLKEEIFTKHLSELPILSSLIVMDLLIPLNLKKHENGIFSFSLFRKIGMLVLAQNYPSTYKNILKRYQEGLYSLYQIEKYDFNVDSTEVGIKVFKHWKFPNEFIEVVANQNITIYNLKSVTDIDRICFLGEVIAKRLIGIPLTREEITLELIIFEYYSTSDKVIAAFNEKYYESIKDHPFFIN